MMDMNIITSDNKAYLVVVFRTSTRTRQAWAFYLQKLYIINLMRDKR